VSIEAAMSEMGQTRHIHSVRATSALTSTATESLRRIK
jgi:hypothetical protein